MRPCKRIEIVIEEPLATRLAAKLAEIGVPGYTMLPRASGRGDRGLRRADDPTGNSTNCVFLIACEDETKVQQIIDNVRPIIARSGGICLVSDAAWLIH